MDQCAEVAPLADAGRAGLRGRKDRAACRQQCGKHQQHDDASKNRPELPFRDCCSKALGRHRDFIQGRCAEAERGPAEEADEVGPAVGLVASGRTR